MRGGLPRTAGARPIRRPLLHEWQLALPATLFLAAYFIAPLAMLFWWSFSAPGVAGPTLGNYRRWLGDPFFLETLWRTVRMSLEVTAITLILAYPLAYLYTRLSSKWRTAILFITVLPLLTSAVVRSFGWIVILGKVGLINTALLSTGLADHPVRLLFTYEGVRIALAQVQFPFMLLPLINSMEQIDPGLEDAAMSLGASQVQAFVRVTVPLSIPGVIAGSILTFALTISAFITPAMVGGGTFTLMATLIYQSAIVTLDWEVAATTAFILLVVACLIVWLGHLVGHHLRHGTARH